MLLHIGGDMACNTRWVIAILDMPSCGGSRDTRAALRHADRQGLLRRVGQETPRAAVLLSEPGGQVRIVLTPFCAATLRARLAAHSALSGYA